MELTGENNSIQPGIAEDAPIYTSVRVVSPLDVPHSDFVIGLERRTQNRDAFLLWVERHLHEGVDFGRIHVTKRSACDDSACTYARNPRHWSKPNMFKPGAEKVTGALGIRVMFPAFRDYERAALDGRAITQIVLRCRLEDGAGNCFAEGIGARSVEEDYGDVNKSLKMGAKSAQVDAVLRLGGLSEIFTQGLEDMHPDKRAELSNGPEDLAPPRGGDAEGGAIGAQAPLAPPPRQAPVPAPRVSAGIPISDGQVRLLHVKLDRAGVSERELIQKYGVARLEELPRTQMDPALAWLASLGTS